jgi:outer membrane protein OmpA-like peptidoglycan-associated protein
MADMTISVTADHFDFDSAVLKPKMQEELDRVVSQVRASRGDETLMVVGHTDSTGPEAYNQGLSERRAESAANYLMEQGIPSDRISTMGAGESEPVTSNDTREGRAMNRRVEVRTR